MKIELNDGLEFELNDKAVNDWRLVEMFSQIEDNPFLIVNVAKFILTEESYAKLLKVNTDEEGHIDAEKIEQMLVDIFMASNTTKK